MIVYLDEFCPEQNHTTTHGFYAEASVERKSRLPAKACGALVVFVGPEGPPLAKLCRQRLDLFSIPHCSAFL